MIYQMYVLQMLFVKGMQMMLCCMYMQKVNTEMDWPWMKLHNGLSIHVSILMS